MDDLALEGRLRLDDNTAFGVTVSNYWETDTLRNALTDSHLPLESWSDIETAARSRFPGLTFTLNSFEKLHGYPFNKAAAKSAFQHLARFNENGERTTKGHELYRRHFMGERAWFSDSSTTEKSKFEQELTFPHPTKKGELLKCPWHGKVEAPHLPLRIHFSWPIKVKEPLYVVYVGQKLLNVSYNVVVRGYSSFRKIG